MSEIGHLWGDGTWHVSVPAADASHLEDWHGACWTRGGLEVPHPENVRVLSLMIHDSLRLDDLVRFPQLEAVITRSDGFDHVPVEALAQRGVATYHLEGYATDSVAHLALTFLLMLARRIPDAMATTQTGSWNRSQLVGQHLGAMTVGIVGTGRIGTATAQLLDAMGVPTIGYDVDPAARPTRLRHHKTATSLHELLASSDAISLHVPLNDSTRHLLGPTEFAAMRPGALLVNTARGGLVDMDALLEALDGGLAGYAADVLDDEPAVPDLPRLMGRSDVVLTPHLGAHNDATIARRYAITQHIAQAILDGAPERVARYRVMTNERA